MPFYYCRFTVHVSVLADTDLKRFVGLQAANTPTPALHAQGDKSPSGAGPAWISCGADRNVETTLARCMFPVPEDVT